MQGAAVHAGRRFAQHEHGFHHLENHVAFGKGLIGNNAVGLSGLVALDKLVCNDVYGINGGLELCCSFVRHSRERNLGIAAGVYVGKKRKYVGFLGAVQHAVQSRLHESEPGLGIVGVGGDGLVEIILGFGVFVIADLLVAFVGEGFRVVVLDVDAFSRVKDVASGNP